jgi:hypothetical protein
MVRRERHFGFALGKQRKREDEVMSGTPTPPVFCKRVCKLLKRKETNAEKRGKSVQEAANHWEQRAWKIWVVEDRGCASLALGRARRRSYR